ncbi:MAG: histidine kinase dimerization/phospho-acceptor domain-containing protein [Gemmatimonadales bacterium]
MALSRFRLRLTAGFAVAFLIGLVALNAGLYGYLRRQGSHRVTGRLASAGQQLTEAIRREETEPAGRPIEGAVNEALGEWPDPSVAFVVLSGDGSIIGSRGDTALLRRLPSPAAITLGRPRTVRGDREGGVRYLATRDSAGPAGPPITIVTATSTAGLIEDQESLVEWMIWSAPLALLLSLIGGYLLSRLALGPVATLGRAVAAIPPDDLHRRLPVATPPDEIDQLAEQFNDLLRRLHEGQNQNRRFLETAAHQIRTPLTLVLGESELALESARAPEERLETLRRIRMAAQQMRHRVSDLFLLARAQAGERPTLTEQVELDGLVLESADLFRGRAQALGRSLELGVVEGVEVQGDAMLLREAVIELIENACRHSTGPGPVRISVTSHDDRGAIAVENPGAPLPSGLTVTGSVHDVEREPRGLGLALLRWIARAHGGTLTATRDGEMNRLVLEVPLATP